MNRSKHILLSTGLLLGVMFTGPIMNDMATLTTYAAELTQSARWVGSGDRWQVSDNAGGFLKNQWFQDDVTGHWYLLGAEDGSVMYSGLVTDQSTGKSYLLNTNHDGTFGRMLDVDGVYNINGVDVYLTFDQTHNGTHGAILTGLDSLRSTGVYEKQYDQIPIAQPETQTPTENPTTQSNGGTGEGGSTTSSTDDMNQTGKITDPNDLKPGQFAIIDEHMWARDPSSGTLYDMGSTAGSNSGYVAGIH